MLPVRKVKDQRAHSVRVFFGIMGIKRGFIRHRICWKSGNGYELMVNQYRMICLLRIFGISTIG